MGSMRLVEGGGGGASSASISSPRAASPAWWEPVVDANRAKPGGLRVYESPVAFDRGANGFRLLQLLRLLGADPSAHPDASPGTIVAIGLPAESAFFAEAGYRVQAFEARKKACGLISKQLGERLPAEARRRVQLHRLALSNYTGTTEIFDAADSSSLLRSAVEDQELERKKFVQKGRRLEVVPVTTLDEHFRSLAASGLAGAADSDRVLATSVVGMQIDTQGVEPEILMGAQSILGNPSTRPRVVVVEYCTRFRPFDELSIGVHLLIGLGYTCYYDRKQIKGDIQGTELVMTPETAFAGDFYCTIEPLDSAQS
jgi:hypothetical protein